MSCPHGSGPPEQCSQCLGVQARPVRQIVDGVFQVGDEVVSRQGAQHQPQSAEYGTVATNNVPRCTFCRKAGHATDKCKKKLQSEATAAAFLTAKAG